MNENQNLYFELGLSLMDANKTDDALKAYKQAIESEPEHAAARYQIATILSKRRQYYEAKTLLKEIVEIDPKFPWSYYELGNIHVLINEPQEAANCYKKLIEIAPEYAWSYYKLAEILLADGKQGEALELYKIVIEKQPNSPWVHAKIADILHQNDNTAEAAEFYRQAGSLLKSQGKLAQAESMFRKSINLGADCDDIYFSLGNTLVDQGKIYEAISIYKQAVNIYPSHSGYYCLAEAFKKNGQIEAAIDAYKKAVTYDDPKKYWTYNLLAETLFDSGKRNESYSYYQQSAIDHVVKVKPDLEQIDWHGYKPTGPDFIIIGVAKTASTSLFMYLNKHPNILPPVVKEPMFFSKEYKRGLDWYLSQFPPTTPREEFITGEGSINYIVNRYAPQRIYKTFPKTKLILMLREPVSRTISDYYMWQREGWEKRSLEDAILFELEKLKDVEPEDFVSGNHWRYPDEWGLGTGYILRSLYLYHLQRWRQIFPEEQFLILQTEDLAAKPEEVLSETFDFLGVSEYKLPEYKQYNKGVYQHNTWLEKELAAFFKPHNQLLEDYLGYKLAWNSNG